MFIEILRKELSMKDQKQYFRERLYRDIVSNFEVLCTVFIREDGTNFYTEKEFFELFFCFFDDKFINIELRTASWRSFSAIKEINRKLQDSCFRFDLEKSQIKKAGKLIFVWDCLFIDNENNKTNKVVTFSITRRKFFSGRNCLRLLSSYSREF